MHWELQVELPPPESEEAAVLEAWWRVLLASLPEWNDGDQANG